MRCWNFSSKIFSSSDVVVTENKFWKSAYSAGAEVKHVFSQLIDGEEHRTFSVELRISTRLREAETLKNSRQLEITCYKNGKLLLGHNFYLLQIKSSDNQFFFLNIRSKFQFVIQQEHFLHEKGAIGLKGHKQFEGFGSTPKGFTIH